MVRLTPNITRNGCRCRWRIEPDEDEGATRKKDGPSKDKGWNIEDEGWMRRKNEDGTSKDKGWNAEDE